MFMVYLLCWQILRNQLWVFCFKFTPKSSSWCIYYVRRYKNLQCVILCQSLWLSNGELRILNDSFATLGFKLGNYLIHEGVHFYEPKFLNNHPEKWCQFRSRWSHKSSFESWWLSNLIMFSNQRWFQHIPWKKNARNEDTDSDTPTCMDPTCNQEAPDTFVSDL